MTWQSGQRRWGLPEYELPGRDQPRDRRTCMVWKNAQLSEIDSVTERQHLILADRHMSAAPSQATTGLCTPRSAFSWTGSALRRAGSSRPSASVTQALGGDGEGRVDAGWRTRELLMTNPAWDPIRTTPGSS